MKQLNKTIGLALGLILNASLALAQDGLPPVHIENTAATAGKGAGTGSRLFAQSHYNASFATQPSLTPYDSQRYIYPNTSTNLQSQMLTLQYGTSWVLMRRNDYTYNTAGKMTYMAYQNWGPGATAFTPAGQTFYTLNAAGFVTKDSNQIWLTSSGAYRNNVRNIYTLNSAGQPTDQVYQNWDNGSSNLINYYHYTFTYNTQGKLTQQALQDWDASIHWMDYTRSTYTYDAGGTKLQTLTGEQRIGSTPGLQTVYQNVYTLNAAGNPAIVLSNLWSSSANAYTPSSRISYTYDAAGNNLTSTTEQWDAATSAYKPGSQYVFTYNTYNQVTSQTRLFWNGSTYALSSSSTRYNYYYEPYTTSTTGISAASKDLSVSVYPTLCSGTLFVNAAEAGPCNYVITSLSGAAVAGGALQQGANALAVGDLAAGVYFIRILLPGKQGACRFVKQ